VQRREPALLVLAFIPAFEASENGTTSK